MKYEINYLSLLSSSSDLEQSPCASGSSSIAADEENILKSIERREMLLVIDQVHLPNSHSLAPTLDCIVLLVNTFVCML